jgi:hypothetical protein
VQWLADNGIHAVGTTGFTEADYANSAPHSARAIA